MSLDEGMLDGGLPYLAVGQGPPLVVLSGFYAATWLPFGAGPAAMGRYQAAWQVTHVVLPCKVANPSVWARLRGHTLADFQAAMPGVEILLVYPDGRLQPVTGRASHAELIRTRVPA
jgi:hypothetical protein